MQADGLDQLAKVSAGHRHSGDPFRGHTENKAFTCESNPSTRSYARYDPKVPIADIFSPAPTMTMNIAA
jgi:hypothetical protein